MQMRLGRREEPQQPEEAWHQFRYAVRAFLDPLHISQQDRVVDGEERWRTNARVSDVLLVVVAYAVLDEGKEVIHIISARRVTRQERIEYEEASER
jgi:uncharacterized DUF497 family protein